MVAGAVSIQGVGNRRAICQKSNGFLDQCLPLIVCPSLAETALVSIHQEHPGLVGKLLDEVKGPRFGPRRVFEKKIPACRQLSLHELARKLQVVHGSNVATVELIRIHIELGQVHDGGHVGAHGAENQKLGLGSIDKILRTSSRSGVVEIPNSPLIILRREVQ